MNKKVCIYSGVAQNDQVKLDSQVRQLTDFAKQKGLKILKVISETGSGLDFKRKDLSEIMEIAKSKQVDMIFTKDVARIGRDYMQMFEFIENIKKHVEFKTIDGFETSKDDRKNMITVLSKFFDIHKEKLLAKR